MKKASSKYILVLGILTLVILGSQLLMQTTIKGSKSDSRIINISGRQRMLSQKITKSSLKMANARSDQAFEMARKELEAAHNLWSQSHQDLQYGSAEIEVGEMNDSKELDLLYEDIEPYFLAIQKAAVQLIATRFLPEDTVLMNEMMSGVEEISNNEASFLSLMNKITFQYDRQAFAKVEALAEVEYYLMGLTFILILLEAFFIFRPMYQDTKQKALELSELTDLRAEEKTYAANQITLANKRIKSLRALAINLKKHLDHANDEAVEKERAHMKQYTELAEEFEKTKMALEIRKGHTDSLPKGEDLLTS